jgi:ribosome-binding protein aMBF1 (putative translation factor)
LQRSRRASFDAQDIRFWDNPKWGLVRQPPSLSAESGVRKSAHSEKYIALLVALRSARERAGLTQKEVGRRLARPQSFVAKYERGERRLDVVEFAEIAKALEVSATKLFSQLIGKHKS